MTNITKKQIETSAFMSAEKQLARVISRLKASSALHFLYGFLTESERIMLTKRFGAIFLLHKSYSPYRVAKLLGISEPTIHRYQKQYFDGAYDSLLKQLSKEEENAFLSLLTDFALSKIDPGARRRLLRRAGM